MFISMMTCLSPYWHVYLHVNMFISMLTYMLMYILLTSTQPVTSCFSGPPLVWIARLSRSPGRSSILFLPLRTWRRTLTSMFLLIDKCLHVWLLLNQRHSEIHCCYYYYSYYFRHTCRCVVAVGFICITATFIYYGCFALIFVPEPPHPPSLLITFFCFFSTAEPFEIFTWQSTHCFDKQQQETGNWLRQEDRGWVRMLAPPWLQIYAVLTVNIVFIKYLR